MCSQAKVRRSLNNQNRYPKMQLHESSFFPANNFWDSRIRLSISLRWLNAKLLLLNNHARLSTIFTRDSITCFTFSWQDRKTKESRQKRALALGQVCTAWPGGQNWSSAWFSIGSDSHSPFRRWDHSPVCLHFFRWISHRKVLSERILFTYLYIHGVSGEQRIVPR